MSETNKITVTISITNVPEKHTEEIVGKLQSTITTINCVLQQYGVRVSTEVKYKENEIRGK